MNVRFRAACILLALVLAALALGGCGATGGTTPAVRSGQSSEQTETVKPAAVKIGTLPTEDSLPLWVAEKMGYFATNDLDSVEIVTFQSAQERDAAFAAGAIDAYMGDIIASANLEAAGTPVTIKTVMLGADQSQGRFGIVASPVTPADAKEPMTVADLAGVPVGTSSATIQEYVLDGLMGEAGVAEGDVKKEEVKKVPVRFELLMAGKLRAAALPEPFLTLAEQGKARLVGDDTKAKANLSQTVLVFSDKYLADPAGAAAADAVLEAWDVSVAQINDKPEDYRDELVDKARLPKPLAGTYAVNTYPTAAPPSEADVTAVLEWMKAKGYLKADVTYADLVDAAN